MKKILFVVMVSLVTNTSNAFEDLQATPPRDNFDRCDTCGEAAFLELDTMPMDEYDEYTDRDGDLQDDDQALSEDDQNDQTVADTTDAGAVTPPATGTQAMIKQMFGSFLVHCAALKDLAHVYFNEFKDVLAQWYHAIVKPS